MSEPPYVPQSDHDGSTTLAKLYQMLLVLGLDPITACHQLLILLVCDDRIRTDPELPKIRPYEDSRGVAVITAGNVTAGSEVKIFYQESAAATPPVRHKPGNKGYAREAAKAYLGSLWQRGLAERGAEWLAHFAIPPIGETGAARVADTRRFKIGEIIFVPPSNYLMVEAITPPPKTEMPKRPTPGTIRLRGRSVIQVVGDFFKRRDKKRVPANRSIQRYVEEWLKTPRPEPTPFEQLPLLRQIELLIQKLPAEAWPRVLAMRPVEAGPRLEDEFIERLSSMLTEKQWRLLLEAKALRDAAEEPERDA